MLTWFNPNFLETNKDFMNRSIFNTPNNVFRWFNRMSFSKKWPKINQNIKLMDSNQKLNIWTNTSKSITHWFGQQAFWWKYGKQQELLLTQIENYWETYHEPRSISAQFDNQIFKILLDYLQSILLNKSQTFNMTQIPKMRWNKFNKKKANMKHFHNSFKAKLMRRHSKSKF